MGSMLPSPRQTLFATAIILAVAGSGLAGFLLWKRLQTPHSVSGVVAGDCDLNRAPCQALFPGGGTLTVSLTPRPIPLAAPLTIEVQLNGLAAASVEIDLSSPDLAAGYNHHTLTPQGDGRFAGPTVLPLCARDRMRWHMQVTARTRWGTHGARFDFETAAAAHRRG